LTPRRRIRPPGFPAVEFCAPISFNST
jgi:hypothetical protein